MSKISVVVATFNEEKNISKCLSSIYDLANEIILVDAKSSDRTVEMAKKYKPKIFFVDNEPIFHKNKQYGLEKAQMEWILQLDADEVVTNVLKEEIKKTIENTNSNGFYIPRKNNFMGRFMQKGGLYPDGVVRLVRKDTAFFPCKSVHEQISVKGNVGWLKNPLLHYPYPTIGEYLKKANRYTTLTAVGLKENNVKVSLSGTFKYCIILPIKTFFNIYIRHQGILDGLPGFIWAFLSSTHYFLAYAKLLKIKNS